MKILSLLIGIATYDSNEIQNLPFCLNDISKIRDTFRKLLGIPKKNMIVQYENTNRLDILKSLRKINLLASNADLLIIYYTGHGTSISNVGYIIPSDTDLAMIEDTAIPIKRFQEALETLTAKNKILVIDSCYSGVNIGKQTSNPDFINQLVTMASTGWTILSSSKGSETSHFIEEKQMSVFSYYFNESLVEHASRIKKDGTITIDDIVNTTTKKIVEWSLESNKLQTPTLKTERAGSFILPIKHNVVELVEHEKSKMLKPTEISLKHYFWISSGFDSYAYDLVSTNQYRPLGQRDLEKKWHSYSEEERIEIKAKTIKEKLEKLNGCLLEYITPSQIKLIDNSRIQYPFGELLIIEKKLFDILFKLSINVKSIDNIANDILNRIDDQDIIEWESLLFKYEHKLDFDKVLEISKESNYPIKTFDIISKVLSVGISTNDVSNLEMIFTNIEDNCSIEIKEQGSLRKDFFEIVPIDKMVEIFSSAII